MFKHLWFPFYFKELFLFIYPTFIWILCSCLEICSWDSSEIVEKVVQYGKVSASWNQSGSLPSSPLSLFFKSVVILTTLSIVEFPPLPFLSVIRDKHLINKILLRRVFMIIPTYWSSEIGTKFNVLLQIDSKSDVLLLRNR